MRLGSHVNFLGTIGTASILLWSLSQSKAKPEFSPAYIQVQTLPKLAERASIHLASSLHRARVKTTRHLIKDVTIRHLCKLHKYAGAEPKEPTYQLVSKEIGDALGSQAETNETLIRDAARPKKIKETRRLVKDVTVVNLCKLRKYASVEPKEPVEQLASKGTEDEREGRIEITVTPFIRDIMNKARPKQITGTMTVEGKEYQFGSGGRGQSIPYGDYLITPDAIGSWGSRHGAIGVANGTIPDPKLHRDRDGIELHAAGNSKLETDGCVSIRKDQWPEFRKQVLALAKENKRVYLHVSEQGASVSTNPLEFIGETISEPTVSEVLSMIDTPARKARE
ncbi:MAG TPA: hypothetical protein VIJ04_04170 [Xanthobacteraceae bacterium]